MKIKDWELVFVEKESNYNFFQQIQDTTSDSESSETRYLIEYRNSKTPNSKLAIISYDDIHGWLCIETFSEHRYKIDAASKQLFILPPLCHKTLLPDGEIVCNV